MARRLILDSGVLSAAERQRTAIDRLLDEDDDVVIAAVTVAELGVAVELADGERRDARAAFLLRVLDTLPVIAYDVGVAQVHARLLAATYREGRARGAHDLIIAATAVATGRTIVTGDRAAHFDELPGVEVIVVEP